MSDTDIIRAVNAFTTPQERARLFNMICHRYYRRLYEFVHLRLPAPHKQDVCDIVQESFHKAFQYIGSFHQGRQVWPWLCGIARNCMVSHLKRLKKVGILIDPAELLGIEDERVLKPAHPPSEIELQRLLSFLTPQQRQVFTMKFDEHLSYKEIARALGCAQSTVRSHLASALKALREGYARLSKQIEG